MFGYVDDSLRFIIRDAVQGLEAEIYDGWVPGCCRPNSEYHLQLSEQVNDVRMVVSPGQHLEWTILPARVVYYSNTKLNPPFPA